ncbi:MAG: hypothetical protein ACJAYU_004321 [Bradymonadia bacterium]
MGYGAFRVVPRRRIMSLADKEIAAAFWAPALLLTEVRLRLVHRDLHWLPTIERSGIA